MEKEIEKRKYSNLELLKLYQRYKKALGNGKNVVECYTAIDKLLQAEGSRCNEQFEKELIFFMRIAALRLGGKAVNSNNVILLQGTNETAMLKPRNDLDRFWNILKDLRASKLVFDKKKSYKANSNFVTFFADNTVSPRVKLYSMSKVLQDRQDSINSSFKWNEKTMDELSKEESDTAIKAKLSVEVGDIY